jgi:hypothetical protein
MVVIDRQPLLDPTGFTAARTNTTLECFNDDVFLGR